MSKEEEKGIHNVMRAGLIYKAIEPYDDENPQYNCYVPAPYADDCYIGDCGIFDEDGNQHPDIPYTPIHVDNLGEVLGCAHSKWGFDV